MLSRATQTPQMLARLDEAIDELKRSGEFRRIADSYALPRADQPDARQRLVPCSCLCRDRGVRSFRRRCSPIRATTHCSGPLILATLPAVGGGVARDLILQREPLGIVRSPVALLTVFGTVLVGMAAIKSQYRTYGRTFGKYLHARADLATKSIESFDPIGLAAFTVVSVVVVLDPTQQIWYVGRSRR